MRPQVEQFNQKASKSDMSMVLMHPGADFSTADVFDGYKKAFKRMGISFEEFRLNAWMSFYSQAWRMLKKKKQLTNPELHALASTRGVLKSLYHDPDITFIFSAMMFHPDALVMLKRSGQKVAIFFTESPYDDEMQLKLAHLADWVFINDPTNIDKFRAINPNSWYLPHAHDPRKHRPMNVGKQYESDVCLIGTGFQERISMLEQIDWSGINLKVIGYWELVEKESPIFPFVQKECIDNVETVKYYNGSKICLNIHRESKGFGTHLNQDRIDSAYSLNPRAYEIPACGAFQICDNSRPELEEIFGDSVPSYSNWQELEQLIKHYLANPVERKAKAREAQERVKKHTFDARAAFVLEKIRETYASVL